MSNVIAIDGPAGAGKSTISRLLAKELGYKYLDTGAMYRAITLFALQEGINLDDEQELTKLAKKANIKFIPPGNDDISHIILNGKDITNKIRNEIIDQNVSRVAMVQGVREEMVKHQRKLAREGGIVMDGRDIGSQVLPDANYKFFVTASLEERARRRYNELKDRSTEVSLEDIKENIIKRDKQDIEREHSPLIKTNDAILIDTTNLSIKEVITKIISYIKRDGENE